MKYAVISLNGVQYKVSEGDKISVDRMEEVPDVQVLLYVNEDKRQIGDPFVKGVKVDLKILEQTKDKKVKVTKYKSKSRYRKTIGFRASKTLVEVTKIS